MVLFYKLVYLYLKAEWRIIHLFFCDFFFSNFSLFIDRLVWPDPRQSKYYCLKFVLTVMWPFIYILFMHSTQDNLCWLPFNCKQKLFLYLKKYAITTILNDSSWVL